MCLSMVQRFFLIITVRGEVCWEVEMILTVHTYINVLRNLSKVCKKYFSADRLPASLMTVCGSLCDMKFAFSLFVPTGMSVWVVAPVPPPLMVSMATSAPLVITVLLAQRGRYPVILALTVQPLEQHTV